jgi:arsenate reductase
VRLGSTARHLTRYVRRPAPRLRGAEQPPSRCDTLEALYQLAQLIGGSAAAARRMSSAICLVSEPDRSANFRTSSATDKGYTARSQIAEAWLRRFGGEWFEVESAGTEPRECVDPLAVAVMAECGVDIRGCRPKNVGHFVREPWDFVITTCDRAAEDCPAFPVAHERIHWSFNDPAASEGTYE